MDKKNFLNIFFNIIKYILFFSSITILILFRIKLVDGLPIFAYLDYIDDDELMVQQAKSLISGNWLGIYGYNTLIKGPVFPLFLALIYNFKLSYILSITSIYIFSCFLFIISIKNVIKNKLGLLIIFAFMLFNPIMYSMSFQRVYRNSLTPSLGLMLVSLYNILLINANNKKKTNILYFIFSGLFFSIIFPFFYYIREDSIWILPFVTFYSIIIIIKIIINIIKKNDKLWKNVVKICILFLPLLTMSLFTNTIKNLNYEYYGAKVVDQRSFESLNTVVNSINKVKNPDGNSAVTSTREKMKMLYDVSPTLNNIRDSLEYYMDIIAPYSGGEVPDGMFLWAFLGGVNLAGYDTYEKENELFNAISLEINTALKNGILEEQELFPFFNDTLKTKFNLNNFIENLKTTITNINLYDFALMDTYGSIGSNLDFFEVRVNMFKELTNDKIILNNDWWCIDKFPELVVSNQTKYFEETEQQVNILNNIRDVYVKTSSIIAIIGFTSYVIITILNFVLIIKKKKSNIFDLWVILSGILGSIVTICLGIAYTATTKVDVIVSFYLMSAYVLNVAFLIFSIIALIYLFINKFLLKALHSCINQIFHRNF